MKVRYENGIEYQYELTGNNAEHNNTFVRPFEALTEGAEMEQGIYSMQFHLFENSDELTASKNLTGFIKTCKTDVIYDGNNEIFDEYTYKQYKLLSGTICNSSIKDPEIFTSRKIKARFGHSCSDCIRKHWTVKSYTTRIQKKIRYPYFG